MKHSDTYKILAIAQFMRRTKETEMVAMKYLIAEEWDVEDAILSYCVNYK